MSDIIDESTIDGIFNNESKTERENFDFSGLINKPNEAAKDVKFKDLPKEERRRKLWSATGEAFTSAAAGFGEAYNRYQNPNAQHDSEYFKKLKNDWDNINANIEIKQRGLTGADGENISNRYRGTESYENLRKSYTDAWTRQMQERQQSEAERAARENAEIMKNSVTKGNDDDKLQRMEAIMSRANNLANEPQGVTLEVALKRVGVSNPQSFIDDYNNLTNKRNDRSGNTGWEMAISKEKNLTDDEIETLKMMKDKFTAEAAQAKTAAELSSVNSAIARLEAEIKEAEVKQNAKASTAVEIARDILNDAKKDNNKAAFLNNFGEETDAFNEILKLVKETDNYGDYKRMQDAQKTAFKGGILDKLNNIESKDKEKVTSKNKDGTFNTSKGRTVTREEAEKIGI